MPVRVPLVRWAIFAVVAFVLFLAANSDVVYDITSPPALTIHVLLRKLYSIVAFALVGGLLIWAARPARRAVVATAALALYSAAIEVAQHTHTDESLVWELVDVVCGALGGALAAYASGLGSRAISRK